MQIWKQDKIQDLAKFMIAVLVNIILLALCSAFTQFVFESNDDVIMRRLANGSETGEYEIYLKFMGIPIGLVLKALYSILPSVYWYSLFFEGCIFGCSTLVLYLLFKKSANVINMILTTIIYSGTFAIFLFPIVAKIQFTLVANVLACTAIITYALWENGKRSYIVSAFLFFLALEVRLDCIIMALPFAFIVWIAKIAKNRSNKVYLKKQFLFMFSLVGIMLVCVLIETVAYNATSKWKNFNDFCVIRAKVFDYEGMPEYSEFQQLYEEMGITKEERDLISNNNHLLFTNNVGVDELKVIHEKNKENEKQDLFLAIKSAIYLNIYYIPAVCITIALGYILIFIYALMTKNILLVLELAFTKIASLFIFFVIFTRGRFPLRVILPIYCLELACLICIWVINRKRISKKQAAICFTVCLVLFTGIYFKWAIRYIDDVRRNVNEKVENSSSLMELQEYLSNRTDNFYYLDVRLFDEYTEDVFAKQHEYYNQVLMGGWLPRSPWYDKKYERYGLTGTKEDLLTDNVYFIFADTDSEIRMENYFNNRYDFEIDDNFYTSDGGRYKIVKAVVK